MPAYAAPVVTQMNTTATNDLSPDGFTWADLNAFVVDKFGNLMIKGQRNNAGSQYNVMIFSNDGGLTWTDNATTEASLTRSSIAYDSANDILHSLDMAVDMTSVNGLIYRQWSIARDASNKITSLSRVGGINLQLDFYSSTNVMTGDFPKLQLYTDAAFGKFGALLAVWSVAGATVAAFEFRTSMVVLGASSSAGGTAGNWKAPVATGDTTTLGAGTQPQVAYNIAFGRAGVNNGIVASHSFVRKVANTNINDIYFFFLDTNGGGANTRWSHRRFRWNGATNDWTTGLSAAVIIQAMVGSGSDSGYNLKYQLITQCAEDTANDRVYVGAPYWRSNAFGDSDFVSYINAAGAAVRFAEVYQANGAHVYAPTLDMSFDQSGQAVFVTYDQTGAADHNYPAFIVYNTAGSVIAGPTLIYTTHGADIPLLLAGRYSRVGSLPRMVGAFRWTLNTPTPPYTGFFFGIPVLDGGFNFGSCRRKSRRRRVA